MSCGSAEVVAVEGPATLSGNGGGPTEAEWAKPPLPRARQKPQTNRSWGG